ERLPGVAILVSIISPRYLKSDWCLRELTEFIKAAETTGGVRAGHKLRVFKLVKTPVVVEQQVPELQHMLGYEFFTTGAHSGRAKELSQTGDAEIQRLNWAKLDDLAHDMTELIESLERRRGGPPAENDADERAMTSGAAVLSGMPPGVVSASAAGESTPA